MKRTFLIYGLGLVTGIAVAIGCVTVVETSRAADTPAAEAEKVSAKGRDGCEIRTGFVADGEQVPLPTEADTGEVRIFLSVREIQDNNEILGRVECFLEADGRTAHVRNVNKFTGEVVARGTANYLLIVR